MKDPTTLKRNEILSVAQELFATKGYQKTTLEEVIAITGGSRRNVYAMFGNKEGLFREALIAKINAVFGRVFDGDWTAGDPETVIRGMGQKMMATLGDKETISIFRVVASESKELPEIGEYLYDNGPRRAYEVLEGYLKQQMEAGVIVDTDCRQLAEQLILIMRGDLYLLTLYCVNRPIEQTQIDHQIESAVSYLKSHLL